MRRPFEAACRTENSVVNCPSEGAEHGRAARRPSGGSVQAQKAERDDREGEAGHALDEAGQDRAG